MLDKIKNIWKGVKEKVRGLFVTFKLWGSGYVKGDDIYLHSALMVLSLDVLQLINQDTTTLLSMFILLAFLVKVVYEYKGGNK